VTEVLIVIPIEVGRTMTGMIIMTEAIETTAIEIATAKIIEIVVTLVIMTAETMLKTMAETETMAEEVAVTMIDIVVVTREIEIMDEADHPSTSIIAVLVLQLEEHSRLVGLGEASQTSHPSWKVRTVNILLAFVVFLTVPHWTIFGTLLHLWIRFKSSSQKMLMGDLLGMFFWNSSRMMTSDDV